MHSTNINHLCETDLEFYVHRTVEFLNHKGNLEILKTSWFYGCGKLKLSPKITQLIRGRAQMRTQVSWLSIQTTFQYHFSNSSIGSLIKLCASHCLWFETQASSYPSLRGVKVVCWLAVMEGRQSLDQVRVRNVDNREGFQIEAKETGLQQAMREEKWVTKKRGGKCQEGPGAETWYLYTFPLDGPWLCLPRRIHLWLIDNQIISVFGGSHLNQEKIKM